MNLRTNDVYICTEPCCQAEIVVKRGANPECAGKFAIRCCCGNEMVREDMLVPLKLERSEVAVGGRK